MTTRYRSRYPLLILFTTLALAGILIPASLTTAPARPVVAGMNIVASQDITGNAGLAGIASEGNGTFLDPYVIRDIVSNWELRLTSTTAHVIIVDCEVYHISLECHLLVIS